MPLCTSYLDSPHVFSGKSDAFTSRMLRPNSCNPKGLCRSSRYTYAMTRRLFLLALAATSLLAEDFTGRVVGISDGDTIRVLHEGRAERVRLWGLTGRRAGNPGARGPSSSAATWRSARL